MEGLNFDVEDFPVDLCTHIILDTKFDKDNVNLFEEYDNENASLQGSHCLLCIFQKPSHVHKYLTFFITNSTFSSILP